MALCVSRSNRDYTTDVSNSFAADCQAGTGKLVGELGRCYKAGYDRGVKQPKERFADIVLPNTSVEAAMLKIKGRLHAEFLIFTE